MFNNKVKRFVCIQSSRISSNGYAFNIFKNSKFIRDGIKTEKTSDLTDNLKLSVE